MTNYCIHSFCWFLRSSPYGLGYQPTVVFFRKKTTSDSYADTTVPHFLIPKLFPHEMPEKPWCGNRINSLQSIEFDLELSPFMNILRDDHVTNLIEHVNDAIWVRNESRKRCIFSYLLRVKICFIIKTWGSKWISFSMYGYMYVFSSRNVAGRTSTFPVARSRNIT
jgi:hypothetical protein